MTEETTVPAFSPPPPQLSTFQNVAASGSFHDQRFASLLYQLCALWEEAQKARGDVSLPPPPAHAAVATNTLQTAIPTTTTTVDEPRQQPQAATQQPDPPPQGVGLLLLAPPTAVAAIAAAAAANAAPAEQQKKRKGRPLGSKNRNSRFVVRPTVELTAEHYTQALQAAAASVATSREQPLFVVATTTTDVSRKRKLSLLSSDDNNSSVAVQGGPPLSDPDITSPGIAAVVGAGPICASPGVLHQPAPQQLTSADGPLDTGIY